MTASFLPVSLRQLRTETLDRLNACASFVQWDAARVAVLGKNGSLTALLHGLSALPPEIKKERGRELNLLRREFAEAFEKRRLEILAKERAEKIAVEAEDVTLTVPVPHFGTIHPVSKVTAEIISIFEGMGFGLASGPDIETQWHNFAALNTPEDHPARTEQDTFYLPPAAGETSRRVLRTQTSGVQIRTLLERQPPFRIIAPGRTYRSDHDATHSPMFHQCEGLVVERHVSLGQLKWCLTEFLRRFFADPNLNIRFRSSYFPFTEPSLEVDIRWERGKGGESWLEVLGAGMVNARVLANCGVNPAEWSGFAFGMGIERLAMLKYGISDLRDFYESDLRWLRKFGFSPFNALSSKD